MTSRVINLDKKLVFKELTSEETEKYFEENELGVELKQTETLIYIRKETPRLHKVAINFAVDSFITEQNIFNNYNLYFTRSYVVTTENKYIYNLIIKIVNKINSTIFRYLLVQIEIEASLKKKFYITEILVMDNVLIEKHFDSSDNYFTTRNKSLKQQWMK